jgi:hypothetical protein
LCVEAAPGLVTLKFAGAAFEGFVSLFLYWTVTMELLMVL